MKTTFLSTLILALALLSCKKDNVPTTPPKDNVLPAKSTDATFKYPPKIEPALLELLKKGLIKDGYHKQADNLSREYNQQGQFRNRPPAEAGASAAKVIPGMGTVLEARFSPTNGGASAHSSIIGWRSADFNALCNSNIEVGQAGDPDHFLGTTGQLLPLEAYVLPSFKCVTTEFGIHATIKTFQSSAVKLKYQSYSAALGWQSPVFSGDMTGTTGQNISMEATIINNDGSPALTLTNLSPPCYCESISTRLYFFYRVHVSGIGWMDWKGEGQVAGTIGEGRAIEALNIKAYLVILR